MSALRNTDSWAEFLNYWNQEQREATGEVSSAVAEETTAGGGCPDRPASSDAEAAPPPQKQASMTDAEAPSVTAHPDGPIWEQIPQELREREQWVVWKFEPKKGGKNGEVTKVPFFALGHKAKSTESLTWRSFDEMRRLYAAGGFDGVGYVVSKYEPNADPYTGIDLDGCRSPQTGKITPEARKIVERMNSYTEITPTGTGLRVWVRGRLPKPCMHTAKPAGIKKLEVYDQERYFTVTGNHVEGTPATIEDRQAELDALVSEVLGDPASSEPSKAPLAWEPEDLDPEDEQAIQERIERNERFAALWNGDILAYDGDDSRADLALCNMLREVLGPNPAKIDAAFRKSKLNRQKWERLDYRQRTIGKALENAAASPQVDGPYDSADQNEESTSAPFVVPKPLVPLYPTPETFFDDDEGCEVTATRTVEGGSTILGEFIPVAHDIAPGLPPHWALVAFLAGVSILVPQMRFENLPLNLWMLGIGRLSSGKGNLFDATERTMRAAGKVLAASGRYVAEIVNEQDGSENDLPFNLYTSGSPEGLLRAASQKAVLVSFEEASAFFEQAAKREYQAGIKQTLCRLYDGRGGSHQLKKAGNSIHVVDPHVAMLAAINREDFVRTVQPADFTSGFLSRMLIVAPDVRTASPLRVPGRALWEDLGRRLGEHLRQFQDVKWAEFNSRRPRTVDELIRARGPRLKEGDDLFWRMLRDAGIIAFQDQAINLDEPQEGDEPATPEGRDIVRAKKLAALFELLSDSPSIGTYEDGDYMPHGAQVGDKYLSIRDENILRAVSLVAAGRAYARRVLRWLGTSEDEIEQKKIVRVIRQHPGLNEARLMDYVHPRGSVYFKRNLEMLDRSGEIRQQKVTRGRGIRYYPGDWTDDHLRIFEEGRRKR